MNRFLHAFPLGKSNDDDRIMVLARDDKLRPVGFDLVEMQGQVVTEICEGDVSHYRPPGYTDINKYMRSRKPPRFTTSNAIWPQSAGLTPCPAAATHKPMETIQSEQGQGRVADAPSGHWVYRLLPRWLWPYAQLARWDRPIGWWLLLWPCWWSAALAATANARPGDPLLTLLPNPWHLVLFLAGAIAMRGAGCTYNDIVDEGIDRKVERTRSRPLPSGQVGRRQAWVFLVLQSLIGLVVLLQFNRFADRARHRLAGGRRHLSVHEAHHQLAATGARPRLLMGRADGLGGGVRRSRCAGAAALCRLGAVGDRLRHDLCASGQGGRRHRRRPLDRAAVRRRHEIVAGRALWRRAGAVCRRICVGARCRCRRWPGCSPPARICGGRCSGSTSTIPTSA